MPHPEEFFGSPHASTKEEVERALARHSDSLINIHLPQPATHLTQAIKDFRRERVLFNEVPFIPDRADTSRNVGFALTLTEYLRRIRERFPEGVDNSMRREDQGRNRASSVLASYKDSEKRTKDLESESSKENSLNLERMTSAEIILQRSCRSSAGTDSFFMVQKLFAAVDTLVTQRTNILGFVPFINGEPPVVIDVFLEQPGPCNDGDCGDGGNGGAEKGTASSDVDTTATAAATEASSLSDDGSGSSSSGGDVGVIITPSSSSSGGDVGGSIVTDAGATMKKALTTTRATPQLIGEIRICNSFAVYVFCSMFFLSFLVWDVSVSLSLSIYYCLPAFSDTTHMTRV
jgi:hypothetical protein